MTISRCEIVNSYWSSSEMKPTTSLTSLLTRDLEVRSAGSSGRALLEKLEFYCFDLRGESPPPGVRPVSPVRTTPNLGSFSSSFWSGPPPSRAFNSWLSSHWLRTSIASPADWAEDGRATTPWPKSWPKPRRRFAGPKSSQKASGVTSCFVTHVPDSGGAAPDGPTQRPGLLLVR